MRLTGAQLSQQELDRGLNNGEAVVGSGDIVAGVGSAFELRCASATQIISIFVMARASATASIFLKTAEHVPTLLFIHGGYWQNRAKETFALFAEGPMAHGINVALIGYTLAPDASLDEIVAEIHAGIDFLAPRLPASRR